MKNLELDLAFDYVQFTNRNIFLTGKAGTGKTTFLRSLKTRLKKRLIVVAPTGVAAINAGGQTIHSFFQLPFGPIITERAAGHKVENPNFKQKFAKRKINIIKSLDLLIIDEISMVRADVLDAIDEVLRRYRNPALPFGGVQLLMIGDLQQLAPVVKDDEWNMMRPYYPSMFFFNSYALKQTPMVSLELKYVYRQSDGVFLDILNEIRDDKLSQKSYDLLHNAICLILPMNTMRDISLLPRTIIWLIRSIMSISKSSKPRVNRFWPRSKVTFRNMPIPQISNWS